VKKAIGQRIREEIKGELRVKEGEITTTDNHSLTTYFTYFELNELPETLVPQVISLISLISPPSVYERLCIDVGRGPLTIPQHKGTGSLEKQVVSRLQT
jgi:hypothetical protein